MPYIHQKRREVFDPYINIIVENLGVTTEYQDNGFISLKDNAAKGELNYIIYKIVKKYLDKHGVQYHRLNDFIGVLECCKQEIYQRIARPYEDNCIDKNGDV
jgi:hypothetical protein